MGTLTKLFTGVLFAAVFATTANAAPTIDSLQVQGYMKKANGQAVTDGTYTLAFGVFQNGVALWGKSYSVAVTNGLFSRSLSGVGSDLSALGAGTGMNVDYSATGSNTTLDAALLVAGGSGGVMVRVYAVSAVDGTNPQFDISMAAVPTAMICESAKGVVAGSVTVAGIATASKVATSAGAADAGKLALLDGAGQFDVSFIPSLPASQIGSGQVAVGSGGTGSTDGSITGTGNITYMSAAGSTTNLGNTGGASVTAIRAGTGGITVGVTGVSGDVAVTAGTTSGNVSVAAGSAGTITVGSASTGAATFGNTGAGAISTLQGGSGAAGSAAVTSAGTGATAVNITTTGVGGGITIAPEATGNLVAGGGSTSGTVTIGNVSTGAAGFGNTGAGAVSTLQGGSGAAGQAIVTSSGTGASAIALTAAGAGGGITLTPNGAGVVAVAGGNGVQLDGSTSGSVTVKSPAAPTSYTITLPTAVASSGQVLTASNGTGATSWSTPPIPTPDNIYYFEDFNVSLTGAAGSTGVRIGNATWTATATAPSGAAVTSTTESGLYRLTGGTAANQTGALSFCGQGAAGTPAFTHAFSSSNPWTYEARISVSASATTNQYLRFGLIQAMTNTTTGAQGVYVEYQPASTTATLVTRNAGGVSAGTTSTFATATHIKWTITYDGTNVTYYKDDTQVGTYAANIPTGIALCAGIFIQGTAAAPTARTIDVDYMYFNQTMSR